MKIVPLAVSNRHALKQRAIVAFSGKRRGAHISFASADLLWKVLTANRWELLKAMAGGGAMTLREAVRRAERDVKAVHGAVHALAGRLRLLRRFAPAGLIDSGIRKDLRLDALTLPV